MIRRPPRSTLFPLHDALPISAREHPNPTVTLMSEYANQHDGAPLWLWAVVTDWLLDAGADRKSTRLNSSHGYISNAGFRLKKKNAMPRGKSRTRSAMMQLMFT